MTKSISSLLVALFLGSLSLFAQSSQAPQGDAILGEWINAEQDAKFLIYKKDDKYFGKITWGTGGDTKDSQNPDPKLRSKNLVGLTILKDFVFSGKNVWADGTIYDPKDGKTYSCKLTLKSARKLDVRGFVGVSMFGRTESWTKITNH